MRKTKGKKLTKAKPFIRDIQEVTEEDSEHSSVSEQYLVPENYKGKRMVKSNSKTDSEVKNEAVVPKSVTRNRNRHAKSNVPEAFSDSENENDDEQVPKKKYPVTPVPRSRRNHSNYQEPPLPVPRTKPKAPSKDKKAKKATNSKAQEKEVLKGRNDLPSCFKAKKAIRK